MTNVNFFFLTDNIKTSIFWQNTKKIAWGLIQFQMDHLYFQFKVVDPSVYGDHFNLIILKILIKKEKNLFGK